MTDTLATLVIGNRWWYDFAVFAVIVGFFLIECLLLWRNSLIGWAMTLKCLTLAGVFGWAMINPPQVLAPESVTLEAMALRVVLCGVLIFVIAVLIGMRVVRIKIVFGPDNGAYPFSTRERDS